MWALNLLVKQGQAHSAIQVFAIIITTFVLCLEVIQFLTVIRMLKAYYLFLPLASLNILLEK